MEHIMKLCESGFEDLKSGRKKREYRLNDEKRKLVRVGDTIKFLKLPDLNEEFVVDVKEIETFDNWFDCYSKYYEEDFKDRYLELKNMHLVRGDDVKSFSIFLETLNEFYR